jgi:hypothetical protein
VVEPAKLALKVHVMRQPTAAEAIATYLLKQRRQAEEKRETKAVAVGTSTAFDKQGRLSRTGKINVSTSDSDTNF